MQHKQAPLSHEPISFSPRVDGAKFVAFCFLLVLTFLVPFCSGKQFDPSFGGCSVEEFNKKANEMFQQNSELCDGYALWVSMPF